MAKGPFKMKGSPMARNFGAPFKKDDVVSKTSPGKGYVKVKGTNIWEHKETKDNKEKNLQFEKGVAERAGYVGPVGRI